MNLSNNKKKKLPMPDKRTEEGPFFPKAPRQPPVLKHGRVSWEMGGVSLFSGLLSGEPNVSA